MWKETNLSGAILKRFLVSNFSNLHIMVTSLNNQELNSTRNCVCDLRCMASCMLINNNSTATAANYTYDSIWISIGKTTKTCSKTEKMIGEQKFWKLDRCEKHCEKFELMIGSWNMTFLKFCVTEMQCRPSIYRIERLHTAFLLLRVSKSILLINICIVAKF